MKDVDGYAGESILDMANIARDKIINSKIEKNKIIDKHIFRRPFMQMKPENLPVIFERESASLRGMEWGGMVVLLYTIPAGTDMRPLMSGMPDDLCQCPHWGYVLKGRLRIHRKEEDLVVSSGELFYVEPGHVPYFEEDTQMIEFSPKDPWYVMIAQISKNLAAIS